MDSAVDKVMSMIDSFGEMRRKQGQIEGALRIYDSYSMTRGQKIEFAALKTSLVDSIKTIDETRGLIKVNHFFCGFFRYSH